MTIRNVLMLLSLSIAVTACQRADSEIRYQRVTPPLFEYSKDFQQRANQELGSKPACPRNVIRDDCSAARTMMDDYGTNRNQIRALNDAN